ncbi:FxSxx-COOH system tetratricopeptide repeat protein [Streptomyces sp. NPDC003023]|uniref:FxSxx-COOH system tetratricopeptide repeat protein n=1 Tax=Streptomyces sp. NPDC003023 TaxID=3364675 RepID=UPI0036A1D5F7
MGAQRHVADGGAPVRESEHFVVAFPGYHRSWANWIAHRLEAHGHRVTSHRWDPHREQPLEEALGDLLLASGRVLLVLSDWFFQLGPRREGEWNDVLRGFVSANADRFAAVNLTNRALLPSTAVLEPVDLWGITEQEAERRLLARLGVEVVPRVTLPPSAAGSRYPSDAPPVWGEVPRRNARFTGRDELLNQIQHSLNDAEPGGAVCALVGMAGIGKTQIATEYAHRFSPDYDVVWWVNSDQRGTRRDRFGELAPVLGLRTGSEPGERIRAVRDALRRGEPHGRWLIVFDGWEEVGEALEMLPQSGTGHVLITSRNHGWRSTANVLEVPVFLRSESTGYLMRRAPHISAADADRVAVEFQDLPLQLAHAAALLAVSRMPVAEYLDKVRTGELNPLDSGVTELGDYPQSSLTSWSILFNSLVDSEPRALEVLKLCACFAPGRIPIGLVRGVSAGDLPEQLRWIAGHTPEWPRALDALVNYSVITRDSRSLNVASGGEAGLRDESVHMHRVVHGIVTELTAGDDRDMYRAVIRQVLVDADPGEPSDSRLWPRFAEILPQLTPSGALASTDDRTVKLVLRCLRYCHVSGEFKVGIELAERVRDSWSTLFEPTAQPLLDLITEHTVILRASGRFHEAYEIDKAALARLGEQPGADEIALMNAHSSVASDLRFLGRYPEAYRLQDEVVTTARAMLGAEEWTTLRAQHNLGVVLRLQGRYREAYEIDLDTLRKRELVLRARHPETLHSGSACARDLRLMGLYQDALARQELGLRLQLQVLGERHPHTLWSQHNLIMCRRRAGTPGPDIGPQMAELLERHERVYGKGHHNSLMLVTDYANYLRVHGDLSLARELIGEAEESYRRLVGQAHPVPTGMQSNTGLLLQAEGDRDGALNMFEQALTGLRTVLGEDHPWTLGCALNAAGGRNLSGRLDDAVELSRDTVARARRVLGIDHPMTLSSQTALAADLRAVGEREEAGKVEEDTLQKLTRTMGAQHQHTLSARQRIRPYWDFEPYLG